MNQNSKPRLLFVSAHVPSDVAPYAGHKSAFKYLCEFTEDYDVDLYILAKNSEVNEIAVPVIDGVNLVKVESLTFMKIIGNLLRNGGFPFQVNTRNSMSLKNYVRRSLSRYEAFHFEFSHSASILTHFEPDEFNGKVISVGCVDIMFQQKMRASNSFVEAYDAWKTYKYEEMVYNKFATNLIVQNEKDKQLLESMFSVNREKIKLKMPFISSFTSVANKARRKLDKFENWVLFWGAMNRKENEEAVIEFWDKYQKLLIDKGYMLVVVGASPTKKVLGMQNEYVKVTGFVNDPTEYFVRSKVGVVPLLNGAGIKVKTIEMLESGLPVISTPIGAEGVSKTENLKIVSLEQFGVELENVL